MDLQLHGKVALVQGATRGLGRGIAEVLAREGCDLMLTARTPADLETTARELTRSTGRRILWRAVDSADLDAMPGLVHTTGRELGALDILVCNSGGPPPGGIRHLTPQQWNDASKLLITAPAYLLQCSLALLEQSASPRFFVVTSSSTRVPVAGLTLSNVLRPGVVGLIKTLVDELGAMGLCCHSIAPGRFDTVRLQNVINAQAQRSGATPDQVRTAMLQAIPAGRLGDPIELGNLVAFLASPLASYLNGGNWIADGGLTKA
jgi:3-oxoacyl-[acyl-carrier protein] reductase